MSYAVMPLADWQSILDSVRAKTGSSAALVSGAVSAEIDSISGGYGDIPTYHFEECARVVGNIAGFKAAHPNSLIFGAVSDIHVAHNNDTYEANTKASIRHAAFGLEMVGAMAGCDFVVNLGDNCWENGIDTDDAYQGAKYAVATLGPAFSRLAAYAIPGNHDKSDDTQNLFDLVGAVNDFDDHGTTQIRGFGYKDLADKKVRVICLNSVDYLNASGGYGMSYEQKDFLMRALDLSAKSDAADWQILLLSHIPLDFSGGDYNTGADIKAILDAYVSGTTASITVNSAYALNEDPSGYATYSGGSLVYDFSGKNAAKIIANIHGHVHTDAYGKMADNEILRMATPNTCFYLGKSESYPDHGNYSIDAVISKTAGTAKDTSAVFYCVDLSERAVYAYAYGAGTDRVATYKDAAVYGVTYALTNVTSGTTASGAVEGSVFTTTLIPAGGAELTSVVVTMGGVDITATAYADGTVTIAEVTGDIVITAVAEVALPYDNLFIEADVQNNTRFNSGGDIVDGSFWCMSTYWECTEGDVFRVLLPDGDWSEHTQRVICTYDASKTHVSNDLYSGAGTWSNDNRLLTATIPAGVSYVRVSGIGGYAGTIITKNEEIV